MPANLLEFAASGCLALGAIASGLAATKPVALPPGPEIPVEQVRLDHVLRARLAIDGTEAFLHRVRVDANGRVTRLEIVTGTRWPWLRSYAETRSVWIDAGRATLQPRAALIAVEGGFAADRSRSRPGSRSAPLNSVAPSRLLGSRVSLEDGEAQGRVLDIREAGANDRVRLVVKVSPDFFWQRPRLVEIDGRCARFIAQERRIVRHACTRTG